MIDWLSLFRAKKPPPLAGAPAVRRQKTYSADSGYAYQYYYQGYRQTERERSAGTEYVFDVSADRNSRFPVSVFLAGQAVTDWEEAHHRKLTSTERYAIAKMALFQAFDERETPIQMREPVKVRLADIEGILERLEAE